MNRRIWSTIVRVDDSSQGVVDGLVARLRQAMGGRSVAEVARASGVPDPTLRKYLSGTTPTIYPVLRLAQALDVNLNWLLIGVGSPKDPMDLSQLERPGFDPCSAAWTWLYINHFPRRSGQEEAVPVRREWLERAGLASTAGLWLSYMPEGEGREGDQPGIAAPGEMIVCRNALGLEEKKPYLFYCEGQMRAGLYHLIDGQRVFMPGRTGTEIAVGDDIILVGEIMGSLGVKGVK